MHVSFMLSHYCKPNSFNFRLAVEYLDLLSVKNDPSDSIVRDKILDVKWIKSLSNSFFLFAVSFFDSRKKCPFKSQHSAFLGKGSIYISFKMPSPSCSDMKAYGQTERSSNSYMYSVSGSTSNTELNFGKKCRPKCLQCKTPLGYLHGISLLE